MSISFSLESIKNLIEVIKELAKVSLDDKTKKDVKEMADHIITSSLAVSDSLTPFITISSDDSNFKTKFVEQYTAFVETYVKHGDEFRTRCEIVKNDLNRLLGITDESKEDERVRRNQVIEAIKKNFRQLSGKEKFVNDVVELQEKFHGADNALREEMDEFLNNTNSNLAHIKELVDDENQEKKARGKLKQFSHSLVPVLLNVIRLRNDLRIELSKLGHV